MIKKLIHTHIKHRHPWRSMKFDELAELYTSMSMRSFGFGLIGVFIPIFLYDNGVSISGILWFFTVFFAMRLPFALVAAFLVGRIGPKHTIAVSTIITAVFLSMLLTYESVGWPLLLLALVYNVANSLFFVAYNVDFSKIQHKDHGGKELGWMLIFEQIGKALGPMLGGVLAGLVAPQATLAIAIVVLVASLVPLFMSNEPVKVHQHITFRGFAQKPYIRDFVSVGAFNVLGINVQIFWPLLIAVAVFSDDAYTKLGILTGFTVAVSIFSTHMYGKFIDSNKGGSLLRWGTIMNVFMMNSMALTTGVGGVIAASMLGQPIALACKMPIAKGIYDNANDDESYRIVYLVWSEIYAGIAKFIFCLCLWGASLHFDPLVVIRYGMVAAGIIGLLMLVQDFPALKNRN